MKVDLGRVFEKGQSYVALSRAATMEGLQVLRFDPKKVAFFFAFAGSSVVVGNMVDVRFTLLASIFIQVAAHPKVIEWNKSLECLTR